jgi:hypothetical protein
MSYAVYDDVIANRKLRLNGSQPQLSNYQMVADTQAGNAGGSRGYASAPNVTFSGGGGSGASAYAAISNGTVASITVSNAGSGYNSTPYVTISGPGTGASLSASISNGQVSAVSVNSAGSGYTVDPIITFSDGGGYRATATATIQGSVSFVTIIDGGYGFTSTPTVGFQVDTQHGHTGSGAQANATITDGRVTAITMTNNGSGYDVDPNVTFTGGGTGASAAYAQATVTGSIQSVTVTNGGSGYTSAPSASVSGRPATAMAFIHPTAGTISSVLLTSELPSGADFSHGIKFSDTNSNMSLDLFSVISSDNNNAPILATNQGFLVKKDIQAGGFLGSEQGAILLNHGFQGLPIRSTPPLIWLMDSNWQYPAGSTLPNNPSVSQLFNHNGTLKMWNGSSWVTGNFSGNYDTLFLFKGDGITPARMDLGLLYANTIEANDYFSKAGNEDAVFHGTTTRVILPSAPSLPTNGDMWLA